MLMQNFGLTYKEHYGMLGYFLEWSIEIGVYYSLFWRAFNLSLTHIC